MQPLFLALALAVASTVAGAGQPPADEIVRSLADRAARWTTPPSAVETLEYDFLMGAQATAIKVTPGERRRHGAWTGTTLQAGFHELIASPGKFIIEVKQEPGAQILTILAKVKDDKDFIRVEAGNGVEDSWSGYFSHGARETTIIVDAGKLVPLEEQSGSTTILYRDWQEAGAGKWVPGRIDVIGSSAHYCMHFAWLGDAVWLLRLSESIDPEATVALTRTRNVRVNGRAVAAPVREAEQRSQEAAQVLRTMLDHNRPWLDGGPTGAGWKPPFQRLAYTFHTVREDVRESCVLDRDGDVVFEVTHDGLGKMKDHVGDRWIALKTPEYASARRGARFALIHARSEREHGLPFDLALKEYARIGCQLDLPLFRYREELDAAAVTIEDGPWAGRPCRVATVSGLGRRARLGCGTMLGFTSWSYVNDIFPSKEVIFIDPERNTPLHETLVSAWDKQTFEIDFGDHVEVEPGQWAPRSIRIDAKNYFTCEYRFQLVAGTHWMLAEVVSWFKPDEKSRGVVEDVRPGGGQALLGEGLGQVEATRALFGGGGGDEPDQQVRVATVPFALGRTLRSGPYEIRVAMADRWTVAVSAATSDPAAPDALPLCFLDEKQRPLFAALVALAAQPGARRGAVSIRGSEQWRNVRSIAVPGGDPASVRLPLRVIPVRWGETFAVNIPDAREGEIARSGHQPPRDARTRAWQVRLDRTDQNAARLALDIVSIDGPQEFYLDLAAALLGESGELLSCGHVSTTLRVDSRVTEARFEIDINKVRDDSHPKYVSIGIAPGEVVSAPMGSRWGQYMRTEPTFEIAALLAAPDDNCRRIGLAALGGWVMERGIEGEFLGDWLDERRSGDGPYRHTHLKPHAAAFVPILGETAAADIKAAAARLLAYSEADGAAGALGPLAADPSAEVREAAAIGQTFLGQPGHLALMRSILAREKPTDAEAAARALFERRERDILIALAHQRSDGAVDLLGETLLADLEGLRPVADDRGQTHLQGHAVRAVSICTLLGRTANPRAARWLLAAAERIDRRPDLAEHFETYELARATIAFPEQTRDRVAGEIETGSAPSAWVSAVRRSDDPNYVNAIRTMLRRDDLTAGSIYAGIRYLWNRNAPEALEGLREVYDRGVLRTEPRLLLGLCEALAARGDGRGLADAYTVLVGLEQPAEPPADEEPRRKWENARAEQQREAEAVFGRASKALIAEFLLGKRDAASSGERRVVLRLLWKLSKVPNAFAPVLLRWVEDPDRETATLTRRLLKRD
jgi:hypothetical protein